MDLKLCNSQLMHNLIKKIKSLDLMLYVKVVKHQDKKSNSNNS